ncbi:hypothetical protein GCM10010339_92680 [Streptomyces alanosinicus]|uniref:Mutator family transposase n=1 Tax=Streptomyces alanosinicus TaxID=68171 RepID=A0A919D9M8_9ACTN|nr:hypothetical protein GCM10010339_92680 [Streptomyces alanosinicus]
MLMGVRADGTEELIAVADGYRESADSWADLLPDCRRRGMCAPVLAVGDDALGSWKSLAEVFPVPRHQRCWVHKIANVANALPKSAQPGAKKTLQEIYNAEGRDVLRLPHRALDPTADHESDQVDLSHRPTADQGHPRSRQRGPRAGHSLQAHRVRPATMAGRERTPPRRPRPRRSPLRTRSPPRTPRARRGMTADFAGPRAAHPDL